MSSDTSHEHPIADAVHKAQDAVGAMVGMASAGGPLAKDAGMFAANAGASTLYEIEAGRIALQRAQSLDIQRFADLLVRDHQRMAATLARTSGKTAELDARRQGLLDHLSQASADKFDEMFLTQQLAAHREAVTLHENFLKSDSSEGLRGVASSALPILRQHLAMATALQSGSSYAVAGMARIPPAAAH